MNTRLALLALAAASLAACGSDAPATATPDAAVARDAVTAPDALPPPDVAVTPDAPAPPDVAVDAPPATGPCAPRAVPSGDFERRLRAGGVERVYQLHVPRGYDAARASMVVINLHGFLSNDLQQADWSNMNEAADARGFIAVHPRGRDTSWNAGPCCGLAQLRGDDDVGFVRAMLDALASELCVDPRRVFATGFSNGAFLAHRLACELSDRIAAIAPVAGDMGLPACAPPRPVPVLQFHGDADLVVPYLGSPVLGFPSVNDSMRGWATRDGCAASVALVSDRGDTRCVAFERCAAGSEVQLCTVRGGGHTWPGGEVPSSGGYTGRAVPATAYMLDFFARHPMP